MRNDVTLFHKSYDVKFPQVKEYSDDWKQFLTTKKRKKEKFLKWNIAISDNRMIIWLHRAIANLSILFFCCKDHPMILPEPIFQYN